MVLSDEYFFATQILSMLIIVTFVKTTSAKAYRKVIIHVPVKIKHHHHTHTMTKHVHHEMPIHYDHHETHIIHPETHSHLHDEEYDDDSHHHFSHGRGLSSYPPTYFEEEEPEHDFDNYQKYKRKRSKKRLFNNGLIGWKGRSDFDKIASEYLSSIKKQKTPIDSFHDDVYEPYDDESKKK